MLSHPRHRCPRRSIITLARAAVVQPAPSIDGNPCLATRAAARVRFLAKERGWSLDDPLFPATRIEVGPSGHFELSGLSKDHWRRTGPIRTVFRDAFKRAGVPYFNPHSFRNTIVALGCERNLTWQEMQAWAQNLGHTSLTTTFGSYGQVAPHQQGELVRNAGTRRQSQEGDLQRLMTMVSEIHAAHGA
jgi:integrase